MNRYLASIKFAESECQLNINCGWFVFFLIMALNINLNQRRDRKIRSWLPSQCQRL